MFPPLGLFDGSGTHGSTMMLIRMLCSHTHSWCSQEATLLAVVFVHLIICGAYTQMATVRPEVSCSPRKQIPELPDHTVPMSAAPGIELSALKQVSQALNPLSAPCASVTEEWVYSFSVCHPSQGPGRTQSLPWAVLSALRRDAVIWPIQTTVEMVPEKPELHSSSPKDLP